MSTTLRLVATALSLHLFAGPVPWSAASYADRAVTMSVPTAPPAGEEYAWVAASSASSSQGFTQVGWSWLVGTPPQVFAYTDAPSDPCMCHGKWFLGPALKPGGSVTVRIWLTGTHLLDQVRIGSSWVTVQWAPPTTARWLVQVESWGPMDGPVCFSGAAHNCWMRGEP